MRTLGAVIGVIALVLVAGVCSIAFLATYEYADPIARLPWQIGYGTAGLLAIGGAVAIVYWRCRSGSRH